MGFLAQPHVICMSRLLVVSMVCLLAACSSPEDHALPPDTVSPSPGMSSILNVEEAFEAYREQILATERTDEGELVVARIGAWELTMSALDRRGGPDHHRRLKRVYTERFRHMEELLAERLYTLEGERRGLSAEELFEEKMRQVDYKPDPSIGIGKPPEERVRMMEMAAEEALYRAHLEYVAELALKHDLEVMIQEPAFLKEVDFDGAGPTEIVIGEEDSPILVEVYTDLQCPHCGAAAPAIDRLVDTYKGRAKFVYRLMTSDERPGARPAAIYATCMYRQSEQRFIDFQSYVFSNQGELAGGERALRQLYMRIGGDLNEIDQCVTDPDVRDSLGVGVNLAMERGISATPTVIIAGVPVVGAHEYPEYQRVMEAALDQLVRAASNQGSVLPPR